MNKTVQFVTKTKATRPTPTKAAGAYDHSAWRALPEGGAVYRQPFGTGYTVTRSSSGFEVYRLDFSGRGIVIATGLATQAAAKKHARKDIEKRAAGSSEEPVR